MMTYHNVLFFAREQRRHVTGYYDQVTNYILQFLKQLVIKMTTNLLPLSRTACLRG